MQPWAHGRWRPTRGNGLPSRGFRGPADGELPTQPSRIGCSQASIGEPATGVPAHAMGPIDAAACAQIHHYAAVIPGQQAAFRYTWLRPSQTDWLHTT